MEVTLEDKIVAGIATALPFLLAVVPVWLIRTRSLFIASLMAVVGAALGIAGAAALIGSFMPHHVQGFITCAVLGIVSGWAACRRQNSLSPATERVEPRF